MSKVMVSLMAGVGLSATAVAGLFLFKQHSKLSADLGFKTLTEFKEKKGGECVKRYFGSDLDLSKELDNASGGKIEASDLSGSVDANGCLVVNWEKTNSSESNNNKWKGGFRWLWSFVRGDKGFVLFVTTKDTIETEKQLDLEGGIYFVEKDGETWSVKKKKEIESSKKLDKTDFENIFPAKGEAISGVNKDNWGFVTVKDELENVCKSSETNCPDKAAPEKKFQGSWTWTNSKDGDKTIDKWTNNLETKISSLFGSDSVQLNGVFDSIKGVWNQENLFLPEA